MNETKKAGSRFFFLSCFSAIEIVSSYVGEGIGTGFFSLLSWILNGGVSVTCYGLAIDLNWLEIESSYISLEENFHSRFLGWVWT